MRQPRRPNFMWSCLALFTCVWSIAAFADTTLDVQVGWGGKARDGRWTPFVVTAADAKPRNAIIEIYAPHDGANAMRVRQFLTLNPQPTTVELFTPLTSAALNTAVVSLKEPNKFQALALFPDPNATPLSPNASLNVQFVGDDSALIGVSGREPTLRLLEATTPDRLRVSVGFLEQRLLPAVPVGYDSLDALVLNAPDLGRMDVERQQAIVDWVRAGGSLLFWPNDDPWPSGGPLVEILPGRVGDVSQLQLTDAQLTSAGLPVRFKSLKVRRIEADAQWERMPMFGEGSLGALRRRVGFGQVLVSPIDLGLLQFSDADKAHVFFDPLLQSVMTNTPKGDKEGNSVWQPRETRDSRASTAVASIANQLGDVPGAGSFDFTYVVVVMVAMMLLVGPVDYFILRKYKRQHWTWLTTTAWIVLITVGALGLGHFLKSGELHYRTIRLVDQADDAVVAATDLVGIYSPRTTSYELSMQPEAWWRPASPFIQGFHRDLLTGWDAAQTYRGNALAPMYINVWNLHFASGRTFGNEKPVLAAKLSIRHDQAKEGADRIAGTITNLGSSPMGRIRIETRAGRLEIEGEDRIAPGATLAVDGPLVKMPEKVVTQEDSLALWRRSRYGEVRNLEPAELAAAAGDLAPGAALQVEKLLKERADYACIYAMAKTAEPAVKLVGQEPKQEHWLAVRALVELKPTTSGGE